MGNFFASLANSLTINNLFLLLKDTTDYSCSNPDVLKALRIVATALVWLKTLIPAFLVISSLITLAKAVMAGNDADTKKCTKSFLIKLFVGMSVFFIPTIVSVVMSNISGYDTGTNASWADCVICVVDTNKCDKIMENKVDIKCTDILGSIQPSNKGNHAPAYYLNILFSVMKYSGIILCVVLTTVEFVEVVLSQNDEGYKKAISHGLKRLCYAAILFFIPDLINSIMKLIGYYGCTFGIK